MIDLTIFDDLEQGSDDWIAARRGILTASRIGGLITPTLKVADNETSRGILETIVAERLTGRTDYVYPNSDMQRGTLDEPYARALYAARTLSLVTEVGFAVRQINGHQLGASPDGLVGDDGGIEIKSRRPKAQLRTIITDTVPADNIAQIQTSLLVLDREWWDYVSYAGGMPLYIKRVYPDPDWRTVILDALDTFEDKAALMIDTYNTTTRGAPVAPYIDHYADIEMS